MTDDTSLFEGLERLRLAALETFADLPDERVKKVSEAIEDYIRELRLNLELVLNEDAATADMGADQQRARATCEATGDNLLTLLYKFEEYLESVLVSRLAGGRGVTSARGLAGSR